MATGALTGTGQGDFHHPVLPLGRLAGLYLRRFLRLRLFRYLEKFLCHVSRCQCIGHVSLLKFALTRAAFARLGPGATRSPASTLLFSSATPICPSVARSGSPCARPTPRRDLLLLQVCARPLPHLPSGTDLCRVPVLLSSGSARGDRWASQVSGSSSFTRAAF